jgi:hypothetical protein
MSTFSNAELQSYVNDTAALELRAAIENAANIDPTLADRIAAIDPWMNTVASAVDALPITAQTAQA